METTTATAADTIFRTLNTIGKKFKSKKYSDNLLKELDAELQKVSGYMGVTHREAVIFSVIFWLNCKEGSGNDVSDISRFLQCDLMDVLSYQQEVEQLLQRKILKKERNRSNLGMKMMKFYYSVSTLIIDAILKNDVMPVVTVEPIDIYQFVEAVSDYIDKRNCEDLSTSELFDMVEVLEDENQYLPMLGVVKKAGLDIEDRTLWYEICDDLIKTGKTGIDCTMTDIYNRVYRRMLKSRELIEKKNKLFDLELIELEESGFISDAVIKVTDKGRELFLGEDTALFLKKGKENKLITPDKIVEKVLYFDENLDRQVNFIRQSLNEDKFINLQNRLESKGLPKGLSVIFYGGPGTGKTESVYQLARHSGRSIMHVDISQSKSMWFGESEKKIKEIFTNYKSLCKSESMKPILLFNEADAIFGKRKDNNASNVAQTENAIQNIILEEMEKLDGILIATTNLNQNLDAAFERRFLFKVKFEKPTTEAKQKIWQSKLEWLSEQDASTLATDYSFSGGEIDNIVRKVIMEEVLNGERPGFKEIIGFCDSEKFTDHAGNKRLGF
jgi:AAA+ superfamily predicted ATPase